MNLEIILSATHIILIMGWVTFLATQTALCRVDWLNAQALPRLIRLARLSWLFAGLMLVSGVARLFWGAKPWAFYAPQITLHIKLAVFVIVLLMGIVPTRAYQAWLQQWRGNLILPDDAQITHVRRWLMVQTHLMILLPILGAMLARGIL